MTDKPANMQKTLPNELSKQAGTRKQENSDTVGCVLNFQNRGSCKYGVFYSREVIFKSVTNFCMINCLTLAEMSNSECHISNLNCIKTA